MTLAVKIIIGIIAAAVITAGAFIIPRLTETPPEDTPPPAVTDTAISTTEDVEQTEPPTTEQDEPTQNESGIYEIDGGTYEGEMADGKRSGYGVWVYGYCRYEGYWQDDKPNGEGTLYRTTPIPENVPEGLVVESIIQGTFKDGLADGEVTETCHIVSGETHIWKYELENGHSQGELFVEC